MDANQYLDALRKRWGLIVVFVILGLLGGAGYAATRPVLYEATSSVYLASQGGDTTAEQLQASTFAQNIAPTYIELATEPVVLNPVITQLHLHATAAELAARVSADLTVNTVIIRVTATDQSAATAARIANAVTASLTDAASTLSVSGKNPAIVMHQVAQATASSTPSSPNIPFLVATGIGIGLIIGLVFAFARELLDGRISSDAQVRETKGLETTPFIGSLSHRRGRNRAANLMLAEPHGISAEEYRRLVTNLEFAGIDRRIRSITVTSALSGDGKTTTAINLASAASERGQRVLLVDADLRRPSVAEYLHIVGDVGLTNVLLGNAEPRQAIQRIGNVDILPSGALPPNVTQLVTSDAMARLFGELLDRYDFVVVDAPPLLPVVDALTFAKLTDGAVLVARHKVTRRKQFAQSIASLALVNARIVGVALNDVRGVSKSVYGYGYVPATPQGANKYPAAAPAIFFAADELAAPADASWQQARREDNARY